MKLNNHGWGFGTFIIFLALFFLVLMVIAYEINKVNSRFIEKDNLGYVDILK